MWLWVCVLSIGSRTIEPSPQIPRVVIGYISVGFTHSERIPYTTNGAFSETLHKTKVEEPPLVTKPSTHPSILCPKYRFMGTEAKGSVNRAAVQ